MISGSNDLSPIVSGRYYIGKSTNTLLELSEGLNVRKLATETNRDYLELDPCALPSGKSHLGPRPPKTTAEMRQPWIPMDTLTNYVPTNLQIQFNLMT
jgi:hypothetical protein